LKERLVRLAADESRHAELAFAFAAWVLDRAPELAHVVEEEVAQWQPPVLDVAAGLDRWGVLDTSTRRRIHREGFETVIHPLVKQLVAPHRETTDCAASRGVVSPASRCDALLS
jgi:hypothetical protein